MKKTIDWLNSELPENLCLALGKGHRCKMCWPWTIGIIVIFAFGVWMS